MHELPTQNSVINEIYLHAYIRFTHNIFSIVFVDINTVTLGLNLISFSFFFSLKLNKNNLPLRLFIKSSPNESLNLV